MLKFETVGNTDSYAKNVGCGEKFLIDEKIKMVMLDYSGNKSDKKIS